MQSWGFGSKKLSDQSTQNEQVNASWFYDPNAPQDGQTTKRGLLFLQQEGSYIEEVMVTLQNGILHVKKNAQTGTKNQPPFTIALQDAHILPTSTVGIYAGIQITFPSRQTHYQLLTNTEEERDEWVFALQQNSLAHVRLQVEELKLLQKQTERELQQAYQKYDDATQQVKTIQHDFCVEKSSLEKEKQSFAETYQKMVQRQESLKGALRVAREELELAQQEVQRIKHESSNDKASLRKEKTELVETRESLIKKQNTLEENVRLAKLELDNTKKEVEDLQMELSAQKATARKAEQQRSREAKRLLKEEQQSQNQFILNQQGIQTDENNTALALLEGQTLTHRNVSYSNRMGQGLKTTTTQQYQEDDISFQSVNDGVQRIPCCRILCGQISKNRERRRFLNRFPLFSGLLQRKSI
eukprot:TRINITY_DN2232_c0_g1_i2.p1 TRINITY_DN2232_c0_g1~~TRINITY_DN2232_c0_g1_i2.p1  ORF type:complete len:414 (+),score=43.99 TRINITY_DN2232_c0_g1_i2:99-1340(+)